MSLTAFAALMGVTQPAVSYWETGACSPRGPALILLRMLKRDRPGMIRLLAKMAKVR